MSIFSISKTTWARCCHFSTNAKKVIAVTGCDTGLGFSLAQRCLAEGAFVFAGCLQPQGPGARKLSHLGAFVQALDVTDVTNVSQAAASVAKIVADNEYYLHAVVNNAGVMIVGEFEWQTQNLIQKQVNVNLIGAFNVAHQFLPQLRKSKGRLVNVVSHCAQAGLPGLAVYGATKAALLNWNDTLRIEQAKYGVRVVSFTPGSFYGDSNIMAHQADYAAEMRQGMTSEALATHEPYFNKVQSYLAKLPRPQGPQLLADEALYRKLMDALLSPSPRTSYKHEPLRYTVYHGLFKLCPVELRDWLVQRFASFPKYP